MKNNNKKSEQLGMNHSTASGRLKKNIIFSLLKELNKNYCYQCGAEINTIEELSVEHKVPYLDSENPKELFFDLNNIAFSHLVCNVSAARKNKRTKHPSESAYKKGCRCEECKNIQKLKARRLRNS